MVDNCIHWFFKKSKFKTISFVLATMLLLIGTSCSEDVSSLAKYLESGGSVQCEHIGFAGSPSKIYNKFISLKRKASKEELIELINHDSKVVRTYASYALLDRELIDPYHLLEKCIDDEETIPTFCGCLMGGSTLSEMTYSRYRNNRIEYPDEDDYENFIIHDSKELLKMDSLIIYSDNPDWILLAWAFENRIYPYEYKSRIQERAFLMKDFYALKYVYQHSKQGNEEKLEKAFTEFIALEKDDDIFYPGQKDEITQLLKNLNTKK